MIDVPTATQAGQLAAAIDAVNAQIQIVNDAIAACNVAITCGQIFFTPNIDNLNNFQISQPLTVAETTTCLNAALTILNARLSNYQALLAAIPCTALTIVLDDAQLGFIPKGSKQSKPVDWIPDDEKKTLH